MILREVWFILIAGGEVENAGTVAFLVLGIPIVSTTLELGVVDMVSKPERLSCVRTNCVFERGETRDYMALV